MDTEHDFTIWGHVVILILIQCGGIGIITIASSIILSRHKRLSLDAELEIRQLHQKIDHLLSHQWERLVEIQEVQLDLLDEIRKNHAKGENQQGN